jgi:hypothetical protein
VNSITKTCFKRRKAPLGGAYRCASKNRVKRHWFRQQAGAYLIELLVALLMSTMLATTLYGVLSANLRLATRSQNDVAVDSLSAELTNYTRGVSFEFLEHQVGTQTLLANGAHNSNTVHPNQLQVDSAFQGTVVYKIESAPSNPNQLNVTITIDWNDSSRTGDAQSGRRTTKISVFRGVQGLL